MLTRDQHTEVSETTENYLSILGDYCLVSFLLIPFGIFQFELPVNLYLYLSLIIAFAVIGIYSPNLITNGARLVSSIAITLLIGNLFQEQLLQDDIWLVAFTTLISGFLLLTVFFWEDLIKIFWIFAAISSIVFISYSALGYLV